MSESRDVMIRMIKIIFLSQAGQFESFAKGFQQVMGPDKLRQR